MERYVNVPFMTSLLRFVAHVANANKSSVVHSGAPLVIRSPVKGTKSPHLFTPVVNIDSKRFRYAQYVNVWLLVIPEIRRSQRVWNIALSF